MKAIRVQEFGDPEVLELVDLPLPEAADDELLVRVLAIGVNPVETYIRAGAYPRLPELPYTPGGNIAGVVERCGKGVQHWSEGDRVYSAATRSGAYAEYALCGEDQLFRLPDNLSFAQGAALGVPAATAWRGLFIRGQGVPGERVLIHGASGAVGQAAVQLAAGSGMQVFGTAGSEAGCTLVRGLGALAVANHHGEGYEEMLLQATLGDGFDLILEMLANRNLPRDLRLLAPGGRVVIIGSRGPVEIDPRMTMGKETDIRGLAIFNARPDEVVRTHKALAAAIEGGVLVPGICREMPLAEAPAAHVAVMEDGKNGKIVLLP